MLQRGWSLRPLKLFSFSLFTNLIFAAKRLVVKTVETSAYAIEGTKKDAAKRLVVKTVETQP